MHFSRVWFLLVVYLLVGGAVHVLSAFGDATSQWTAAMKVVLAFVSWIWVIVLIPLVPQLLEAKSAEEFTYLVTKHEEAEQALREKEALYKSLIESLPLRMEGHAVQDDAFYVPKEMFETWAENDPIERFRSWLRDNADMSDEEEDEIAAGVKKTLNDALKRAEDSPLPEPSSLTEGVYATPEDLDTPHHK